MRTFNNIFVCLTILVACFVVEYPSVAAGSSDDSGQQLVSDQCASCICKERTGCKTEKECVLKQKYDACGWLKITEPYWIDAGYPVVKGDDKNNDKAFDRCAKNYECSVRALRAYMKRYHKDCNGDGKIDCADFAAIHMDGPWGCTGTRGQEFAKQVAKCLKSEEQSGSGSNTNNQHDQSNDGYDDQDNGGDNENESGHW